MNKIFGKRGVMNVAGAILALGLVGAALLWWNNTEVERLQDPLSPTTIAPIGRSVVRGNAIYLIGGEPKNPQMLALYSQPLRGGRLTPIAHFPQKSFHSAYFTTTDLLVLTQDDVASPTTSRDPLSYRTGDGTTANYSGPFRQTNLLPPTSEAEVRILPRQASVGHPAPVLLRIPLTTAKPDAQPTKTTLNIEGRALSELTVTLTEKGIYWQRPGSTTQRLIIPREHPDLTYFERPAEDTLLFTDWSGTTKTLLTHCLLGSGERQGNVLVWQDARAQGDTTVSRWDAILGETSPVRPVPNLLTSGNGRPYVPPRSTKNLGTWVQATPEQRRAAPKNRFDATPRELLFNGANRLEFAGRYYWFEGRSDGVDILSYGLLGNPRFAGRAVFSPTEPPSLVSSRWDGSDRRTIKEMRDVDGAPVLPRRLLSAGEKLYLIYGRAERGKPIESKWYDYLGRISPDHPEKFWGASVRLPDRSVPFNDSDPIVDDYFYFTSATLRANPLDFLQETSTRQLTYVLCRTRLPQ